MARLHYLFNQRWFLETTVIMKNSRITGFLLILVLTAGFATAQGTRTGTPQVPCPYPITLHLSGGPGGSPAPVLSEFPASLHTLIAGSVWNQKAINKAFGHTFHFPARKECCAMTNATLTVQIRALEGGPGSTSANDVLTVYAGGVSINQGLWSPSVITGQTKPVTITIPASQLSSGMVSFYVEDDTAVVSATLDLVGCCISKQ